MSLTPMTIHVVIPNSIHAYAWNDALIKSMLYIWMTDCSITFWAKPAPCSFPLPHGEPSEQVILTVVPDPFYLYIWWLFTVDICAVQSVQSESLVHLHVSNPPAAWLIFKAALCINGDSELPFLLLLLWSNVVLIKVRGGGGTSHGPRCQLCN